MCDPKRQLRQHSDQKVASDNLAGSTTPAAAARRDPTAADATFAATAED